MKPLCNGLGSGDRATACFVVQPSWKKNHAAEGPSAAICDFL